MFKVFALSLAFFAKMTVANDKNEPIRKEMQKCQSASLTEVKQSAKHVKR
jgi:hypothetical protein